METFSSAQDRPRDKLIQDRHQRELAEKDQKIERLQRANNESCKRHFEAQNRGSQLARALGFQDIFEAQIAIDIAGREIPYKECFERVDILQEGLSAVQLESETLRERVAFLEAEVAGNKANEAAQAEKDALLEIISILKAEAAEIKAYASQSKTTISRLEQELNQLKGRYDALLDVKERAAERYKLDYAKWRRVRNWIFNEEDAKDEDEENISEEEKRRRYKANLLSKKKLLMEIEEGGAPTPTPYPHPPPLGGITNLQLDKENQETPPRPTPALSTHSAAQRIPSLRNKMLETVSQPKPPSSSPNLFNEGFLLAPSTRAGEATSSPTPSDSGPRSSPTVVGTMSRPLRNRMLDSVTQPKAPLSSPNITDGLFSRKPLNFEPAVQLRNAQADQDMGSSPLASGSRMSKGQKGAIASSDTEEDSQAVGLYPAPMGPPPLLPTSPAPVLSSETEADSQSQIFPFPFLDPTPCPARPVKPLPTAPAHSSLPVKPAFPRGRRVVSGRDSETLQPVKARRVNDESVDSDAPKQNWAKPMPSTQKGKGRKEKEKEKEENEAPSSTPANLALSRGQKRVEDYSAYKGRGRYGKGPSASKDTINAQFEINPTRNGGLDFQYDEVVRRKDDRRRMDAGDCECCRDYYEAVGPLPKRLQAPLWRSPPSTPAKPCAHHAHLSASGSKGSGGNGGAAVNSSESRKRRESEISSHKQAISRHRHHWERPKTPPGYWNIGFPDTQEAEQINEQAREMHRRKRDEVEAAAGRENGKYRRR